MERFGEFLVQRGVITSRQLMDALAFSGRAAGNLTLPALSEKFLDEKEMENIAAYQLETGLGFEDALEKLNILSQSRLHELREIASDYRIPLEEILLRRNILSTRELAHWQKAYERRKQEDPGGFLELLLRVEFLQPLAGRGLEELAHRGVLRTWQPGDSIYEEDSPGEAVYLVEAGLVRLTSGDGDGLIELGVVQSGEHFGLSAIYESDARLESAAAVTRSRIWSVHGRDIRDVMHAHPAVAARIASRAGRELRQIVRGVKDRVRAFESNIYTMVLETNIISRELVLEFTRALAREIPGTIQVIHQETNLDLPDALELPNHLEPGDEARVHLLGIPELNPEQDMDRILKWMHAESRHAATLVFLIRGKNERMAELMMENSRRALLLNDGHPRNYLRLARKGRDIVQLVHGKHRSHHFARLKLGRGECLSPVTFKPHALKRSLRKAARILTGREIGLVLGGGGAKCAAHLGVLEVLEGAGVPLDVIAASSSGNMIASAWAWGIPLDELREAYLNEFGRKKVKFPDWTLPLRGHLAAGNPGRRFLRGLMGEGRTFDCAHAYLPVAVDMNQGRDIVVSGCETWRAAFASSAIPGFLPLVEHEGALLADGALANNVPSSHVREYGADFIISVNISPTPSMTTFNSRSIAGNMLRSAEVMMHQTTSRHVKFTDLEIRPDVGSYGMFDFSLSEKFLELGREAAQAKLPELRSFLDQ